MKIIDSHYSDENQARRAQYCWAESNPKCYVKCLPDLGWCIVED